MKGIVEFPVDAHMAGACAGLMQALTDRKLVCIETKCIAKGDPFCLFEVMPEENVDGLQDKFNFSTSDGPDSIRELAEKEKAIAASKNK